MTFPPGATAIVLALYNQHLELAQGTDEQRRELTRMIVQTMLVRIGPGWGVKRASSTRPVSKDSIALDLHDGAFASWDWQNGETKRPQIFDGANPTYPRITDQIFIPVEPVDWLEPEAVVEPPPPPPPPKRDEQLERLIDAVQLAGGNLDVLNDSLTRLNLLLEQITRSGVQVHL